jgi:transposase InsO family protein
MVTPELRRRAVVHLQCRFGVSERRACAVVGQARSTQRKPPAVPDDEEQRLRAWLRAFSARHPRWGWRRAATCAAKAGFSANRKRVQRLWRDEGLKVPYKRKKKAPLGIGVQVGAFCPIRPNVVWAIDFQYDQTEDAKTLKLLNIIDELTRECLAIEVARSITADHLVAVLERLVAERGAPAYLRMDIHAEWGLNIHRPASWRHEDWRSPAPTRCHYEWIGASVVVTLCLLKVTTGGATPSRSMSLLGTRDAR